MRATTSSLFKSQQHQPTPHPTTSGNHGSMPPNRTRQDGHIPHSHVRAPYRTPSHHVVYEGPIPTMCKTPLRSTSPCTQGEQYNKTKRTKSPVLTHLEVVASSPPQGFIEELDESQPEAPLPRQSSDRRRPQGIAERVQSTVREGRVGQSSTNTARQSRQSSSVQNLAVTPRQADSRRQPSTNSVPSARCFFAESEHDGTGKVMCMWPSFIGSFY